MLHLGLLARPAHLLDLIFHCTFLFFLFFFRLDAAGQIFYPTPSRSVNTSDGHLVRRVQSFRSTIHVQRTRTALLGRGTRAHMLFITITSLYFGRNDLIRDYGELVPVRWSHTIRIYRHKKALACALQSNCYAGPKDGRRQKVKPDAISHGPSQAPRSLRCQPNDYLVSPLILRCGRVTRQAEQPIHSPIVHVRHVVHCPWLTGFVCHDGQKLKRRWQVPMIRGSAIVL